MRTDVASVPCHQLYYLGVINQTLGAHFTFGKTVTQLLFIRERQDKDIHWQSSDWSQIISTDIELHWYVLSLVFIMGKGCFLWLFLSEMADLEEFTVP